MNQAALNERIKLRAMFLNNIAVGLLVTGVAGPILSTLYGIWPATTDPAFVYAGSGICLLLSVSLHLAAQSSLGGLKS